MILFSLKYSIIGHLVMIIQSLILIFQPKENIYANN